MSKSLMGSCAAGLVAWALMGCSGKVASDGSNTVTIGGEVGGGGVGGSEVEGGGVGGGEVGGGGIGGGKENGAELLVASAWEIKVSAQWTAPGMSTVPPQVEMTLDVLSDSGALSGILSRDGRTAELSFTRDSGARVHIDPPEYGVRFPLPREAGTPSGLTLKTLTLTAVDDDSDGIADRLTGSGDGLVEQSCGDCFYSNPVTLTLSGTPDKTPPRLNLPTAPVNPVDALSFSATEALKAASLELSSDQAIPLSPGGESESLVSYSASEVLPFSGTWQVLGSGQDYAKLPLDLRNATVTTLADPGIFAQDGFETPPNVALSDGATWVDTDSALPIPSDNHALLLVTGSSATFHLKRTSASETTVSALLVNLSTNDVTLGYVAFKAAVVGGTARDDQSSSAEETKWPTSHQVWQKASQPHRVHLTLTDAGEDVIVSISSACYEYCSSALLVDDLKLE